MNNDPKDMLTVASSSGFVVGDMLIISRHVPWWKRALRQLRIIKPEAAPQFWITGIQFSTVTFVAEGEDGPFEGAS